MPVGNVIVVLVMPNRNYPKSQPDVLEYSFGEIMALGLTPPLPPGS